jgi:hypothetical protein
MCLYGGGGGSGGGGVCMCVCVCVCVCVCERERERERERDCVTSSLGLLIYKKIDMMRAFRSVVSFSSVR